MEKVLLNADIREGVGKEASKKLKLKGIFPAVVYKKGKDALSLQVDSRSFDHIIHTSAGENVLITLKIKPKAEGAKPVKDKTVIIKEIQYHPTSGDILHVDFNEISLTERITVKVPIEPKGVPEGVKADGGVLDHPMKELEIECLPTEIPEKIDVHVETLKIGDSLKVKDLSIPSNVKVLSDLEQTVVSVMPPQVEKPAEELAEEAVAEPEVIREKKPEAEEGAETAAEPKRKHKDEGKEKK
ncbi:MAG: 50S ribosomal protein L25 [Candidatus Omnitrophota bacterium]